MRFRILLATLAATSTLLIGQATRSGDVSKSDQSFLEEALQTSNNEIALGHLAHERAMDPRVKSLGDMAVRDHTLGNQAIEALAKGKGLTLMPDRQEAQQEKLSKLNGAEFDRAYISDMVSGHRRVIAEFEKEAEYADNPEVRSLATNTLPTLRTHYDQATLLHEQLGKKGTADRIAPVPTK
jgi:putative membrane protein